MTKVGWVFKKAFEHGFMVTTQADRPIFNQPNRQQINNLLRIRAAIDVVAETDVARRPAAGMGLASRQEAAQLVEAAVDIADGEGEG